MMGNIIANAVLGGAGSFILCKSQQDVRNIAQMQAAQQQSIAAMNQTDYMAYVQQARSRQNAYKRPATFPRSDAARIDRMNRYVSWKRSKIAERRWMHFGIALGILCGMPIVVAAIGACWQFAIWVLAG